MNIAEIKELPTKEIAKVIRKELKDFYKKEYKFSITSTYNTITVRIESGKNELFKEGFRECETYEDFEKMRENGGYYTLVGQKVLATTKRIVNKYNYDNSDLITDYHDVKISDYYIIKQ